MRPRIICHMLSSIDGRIDGEILNNVTAGGEYETTGAKLKGNAWICGRTTMQLHFAEKKPFVSRSRKASGAQPVFVAKRAKSYAIAVDTIGKLQWSSDNIYGDHLICILSECAPLDYLEMSRNQGISYIVAGKSSVDLSKAVQLLHKYFGIKCLLLEGGGNINGAFLERA
jgi:2,5-diamino-6-(ribosylamino)-4(3H)-pyrimidinone 5'-phosphate reductase